MKRGWIGLTLLLVLLVSGAVSAWRVQSWQSPLAEAVDQSGRAALAGDWAQAEAILYQTEQQWQKNWHSVAAFADHGPMEAVDGLFAQLRIYAALEEGSAFGAVSAELARQLEAIGEAQVPNWWNLL